MSAADTNSWVGTKNFLELSQDLASEVSRPRVVGAELSLETLPRNDCGPLELAHPVGQPHIKVDGEWRSLQQTDCSEIHGNR